MQTHITSGYALHDEKMVSSRGIGLFTSMIGTFAVVIAIVFALASQIAPTTPSAPAQVAQNDGK